MTDCRICGQELQAGDQVVRTDVLNIIEDPTGEGYWGSPIGDNLRPVEEAAERQYSHLGCLGEPEEQEPKRTNARIIDPDEIGGDG